MAGLSFAAQSLQIRTHIGRMLITRLAILLEGFADDVVEFWRHIRVDASRGRRLAFEDGVEYHRRSAARERLPAGRHFIEHDAKTEKIRARVERFAARLFRRHVSDGPY